MNTFNSVCAKAVELTAEQLGIDATGIKMTSTFIDDLGSDSLDNVELIMSFEMEFDVELPDEEAETCTTVGAAVALICKKLNIEVPADAEDVPDTSALTAPMSNHEFGAYLIALGALMMRVECNPFQSQAALDDTSTILDAARSRSGISESRYALVEKQACAALSAIPKMTKVVEAVNGYYDDLTARKHGGVAQGHAINKIEMALGMTWEQRKA
jgi:acyl carrier protein